MPLLWAQRAKVSASRHMGQNNSQPDPRGFYKLILLPPSFCHFLPLLALGCTGMHPVFHEVFPPHPLHPIVSVFVVRLAPR